MTARILLVEDDFLERSRLESALVHLGYEVACAEDGDGALARLAAERFDLVLLDLVLPGLDGMGVLGALKARGMDVPVVAAVTPAGLDAAASAINAGAKDFVVKPAGALRLKVAITNALALGAGRTQPAIAPASVEGQVPHLRLAHDADWPQAEEDVEDADFSPARLALLDALGHARPMEQVEAEAIRHAVSLYGGRMTEVARRLGIGRSTLYRKLSSLGLPVEDHGPALAVAAE
ncbi:response regulator [Xanthobacteraceae bacterium A53D]